MADQPIEEPLNTYVNDLEPLSPGVDYGLKNDDGFDPSKYDFYNPSSRTAGAAFVVRVHETQAAAYDTSYDTHPPSEDPYEDDIPSPLSPIEELDDDPHVATPRRSLEEGQLPPANAKDPNTGNLGLENPETEDNLMNPLEKRSELLFSRQHLQLVLADLKLSLKFTEFLRTYRPDSIPILAYYLDVVKALKTIKYAESIINSLEPIPGHEFTTGSNSATMGWVLEDKADRALDLLVKDDLPAFVAYMYVQTVDVALVDRVTGREDSRSRGIANGLAEVFVLSDPARPDNPIMFTSEEFHRMTGYTRTEFLGRNCRILGGPRTSSFGISRFRASLDLEREHCEVLLNYRKDGTPFINLIMCVPLRDQSGRVRYYLGAQLDITDLVNNSTGLPSLKRLMQRHNTHRNLVKSSDNPIETIQQDEFEQLGETLNPHELEKLVKLRQRQQAETEETGIYEEHVKEREERVSFRPQLADLDQCFRFNGEGSAPPLGYYKTYLLVRPAPSLRILFASPDLRMPGVLQSPLLDRIGGSTRVRNDLAHALEVGRKVTAKVHWLSKTAPKSRARWIHCTPLLGVNDVIGVWMVILVDDEDEIQDEIEHDTFNLRECGHLGSSYTAEAIPWEAGRQKDDAMDVSACVLNEHDDSKITPVENMMSKSRIPLSRQPLDISDVGPSPSVSQSGSRTKGKAYSYASNSDEHIITDDGKSANRSRSRPSSSSSSILTPIQTSMRPKVRIAGRQSMDDGIARKPPINMPYRSIVEDQGDGSKPVRRTYKSLSPYGILFEE